MSNLFLHNKSIEIQFDEFKNGISELNSIERKNGHIFHKHESVYDSENFLKLCENSGFEGRALLDFIIQLNSLSVNLKNDEEADNYFGQNKNAFLGIDFSNVSVIPLKQITDNGSYENWSYHSLSNIDKLKNELVSSSFSNSFENAFNSLDPNIQKSIIDEFNKARRRGSFTPYYPDTKIISDVTPSNGKCSVMELRVYTPIALRVYFCEKNSLVLVASVEQKSNPNQSNDIKFAHGILKGMLGI